MNLPSDHTRARKGTNYMLAIAIDKYKENPLENSKNDAQGFIKILTSKYRFENENVKKLYDDDATRNNIIQSLSDYNDILKEEDSLIIFYAGHASVYRTEEGFIIPYDGNKPIATNILYSEITNSISKLKKPKHIVLFLNCCFAGSFFKRTRNVPTLNDKRFLNKSRFAFAAGEAHQEAYDKGEGDLSPFAEYIIKFLKVNNDDSVNITKLVENVTERVADNYIKQTPKGDSLQNAGHEGGEFSFQLKENEEEAWKRAFLKNSIESITEVCNRFQPNETNQENYRQANKKLQKLNKERTEWIDFLSLVQNNLNPIIRTHDQSTPHFLMAKNVLQECEDEYKKITSKTRAKQAWENIQNEKNIAEKIKLSETFLFEFTQSEYYHQIKKELMPLQNIENQRKDWEQTYKFASGRSLENQLNAYKAFLKEYSIGEYVEIAEDIIKQIELVLEGDKELKENIRPNSLYKYQDQYKSKGGKFISNVDKKINKFEMNERKQSDELLLNNLKSQKSLNKLIEFINDENINEEVREEALRLLGDLKIEISNDFEVAKNTNGINKLYNFLNTYTDSMEHDEAQKMFNERVENAYDAAKANVYIEKNTTPLDDYIIEFEPYQDREISKIKLAKEEIENFKLDIERFRKIEKSEQKKDFETYLEQHPTGIFEDDAKTIVKDFDKKVEEKELYDKCIEHRQLADLRKFIVEFKNSEYFKEISSILDKKENTINAITLFEEIEKLIKLEKREEAEAKIYIYQAKFQDKKQKYDSEIDAFKIQLNKWKKEDSDFEDILNTTNSNSQKMKCHVFLGNPDYIKKRKDVDDILNHRYSQKLALSTSSNIIPNDKVDSSLFTNYSAILKVIVFLFILILVFLGLILFQLLYS
jgi:hypothetical protein